MVQESFAVYAALQGVMEELASIPKNGTMKFGQTSYNYLRADDVQEKINPALKNNGLIVVPSYTVETLLRGKAGAEIPYVYVHLDLQYVSVVDGSSVTSHAVGESQASDDKSINKALTQAIKNAHRAQFQFASGEPEPDDIGASAPAPAPRALSQAKSPKTEDPEYKTKVTTEFITTGKVTSVKAKELYNSIKSDNPKASIDDVYAMVYNALVAEDGES